MAKCCGLCPFSRKNTLRLRTERAEELAISAENPYSDFVCHKSADLHEDFYSGESEFVRGEKSLTCAGFHALQCQTNNEEPEIEIDPSDHFEAWYDMAEHHEQLNDDLL